jgi:hypothetical protein
MSDHVCCFADAKCNLAIAQDICMNSPILSIFYFDKIPLKGNDVAKAYLWVFRAGQAKKSYL